MTVKTEINDTFTHLLLRVDYEDPAGAFAGWFLHHFHQLSGTNVEAHNDPNSFPVFIGRAETAQGYGPNVGLHAEIQSRLADMFGRGRARYLLTLIDGVTPAVIDDSF